jgi:hypothetical protein
MRFATIALTLISLSCSAQPPQPLSAEQREAFIVSGHEPVIPNTEDKISAKFGQGTITREPSRNRHNPAQIDHWAEIEYPKLKLKIYQMPTSELITRIEVLDPELKFAQGIRVGVPVEHVKALLGAPTKNSAEGLVYETRFGEGALVTFVIKNESVEQIVWVHEID